MGKPRIKNYDKVVPVVIDFLIEPKQRVHSPLLATGLASKLKTDAIPCGRRFFVACCGALQYRINF